MHHDPFLAEAVMSLRKKRLAPGLQLFVYLALSVAFVLAMLLRVSLYHLEISDYKVFVSPWYDFIQSHGGSVWRSRSSCRRSFFCQCCSWCTFGEDCLSNTLPSSRWSFCCCSLPHSSQAEICGVCSPSIPRRSPVVEWVSFLEGTQDH